MFTVTIIFISMNKTFGLIQNTFFKCIRVSTRYRFSEKVIEANFKFKKSIYQQIP